jgi:hypothetical protein
MVEAYYTGDDTVAIQAAINAAWADGCANVVFGARVYNINGPLQTNVQGGINPNCQIYVPYPSDFSKRGHIKFVGACPPSYATNALFEDIKPALGGTVLKSSITGSGAHPAVIGGKGPAGGAGDGSFNYTFTTFKNLSIIVPANNGVGGTGPTICGIYGNRLASIIAEQVVITFDGSFFNSVLPTNDIAGIVTTGRDGETMSHLKNVLVTGFRYGLVTGEHCRLDQAQAYCCWAGWVPYNCSAASNASRVSINWCPNSLYVPNETILGVEKGYSYFGADLFYSEGFSAGTGHWWDHQYSVNDAGNYGRGYVRYHTSRVNVGPDYTLFNKNGGANIECIPLYTA